MSAWFRPLRALFVAYVIASAVHVGWVMAHEPFSFDAWNVASDTRGEPITAARFVAYWKYEYTHSNPRLGQPLTYLAYKVTGFAEVATPLAFVLLALAVVVLGLGRWPRGSRGRDLALVAIALGFSWFTYPQLGKTMFCRAYGANYLYGAVMQLWFLVPLRLAGQMDTTSGGRTTASRAALYAVAGIAAGMCNEHTGPTLCLGLVLYALYLHRRTRAVPTLAWAGAAGAIVGFAAIFFAPGQGERYAGLAQRVTLGGRLLQRGLTGNVEIYRQLILGAAPLVAVMVLVAIVGATREPAVDADPETRARTRRALQLVGLAMAAGSLVVATIFVSPKLGPRFYLLPMALLLAGFIAFADAQLASPRQLAPFVALAVIASLYAGFHTIPLYGRLATASTERLAQLARAAPGSTPTIDAFEQVDDSWWFLGDDFRDILKRELVSDYDGLADIVLRAYDPTAPLGVSDVRLVPHSELVPAGCDDHGGLQLGAYRGLDVASIQKALVDAVRPLRGKLGAAHVQLASLDLAVDFIGDRPPLPRPLLLVGRWHADAVEGWAGSIQRKTHATTRDVVVPSNLPHDLVMYIYEVSTGTSRRLGTSNGEPLQYVPWHTGMYWALACRPTECFVIAAARQAS